MKRDLKKLKLLNIKVSGSNFKGANFSGADFTGADLSYTNFSEAVGYISVLENVNLEGSNLSNAKLNGAKLNGADFTDANLINANLSKTFAKGIIFDGTNLNFPKIIKSSEIFGESDFNKAFKNPVQIIGVAGDAQASLFANFCFDRGDTKITTGTGFNIQTNIGNEMIIDEMLSSG